MFMKKWFEVFFGIFLVSMFFLICAPKAVYARNFLRTLSLGDVGADVQFVQQVLNMSSSTQIAISGPGSAGNETTFFGNATRNAIIKLQNLYADDILTPAGLTHATGVAGNYTLNKINQLYAMYISQKTNNISRFVATSTRKTLPTQVSAPVISSISPTTVSSGDMIVINGNNFTQNNTILISTESDNRFTNISSPDSKTLNFRGDFSFVNDFNLEFSKISDTNRASVINYLISKGVMSSGQGDGSGYVSAQVRVKNANGTSNPMNLYIKVISK